MLQRQCITNLSHDVCKRHKVEKVHAEDPCEEYLQTEICDEIGIQHNPESIRKFDVL